MSVHEIVNAEARTKKPIPHLTIGLEELYQEGEAVNFYKDASSLSKTLNLSWVDTFLSTHKGQLDMRVEIYLAGKPIDVPPASFHGSQKKGVLDHRRFGATLKLEHFEIRDSEFERICLAIDGCEDIRQSIPDATRQAGVCASSGCA